MNTDTRVAALHFREASWSARVTFRNKREKDRRREKERKKGGKRIRSQDVKHRCFKSRKVFSLSRLCPDAVFIFNEYRYAEEKREGWGPRLSLHFHSTRPMAARQPTGIMRIAFPLCQHSCHIDLYFFYALFIGTSDAQIEPLSPKRRGSMEFFNKKNSNILPTCCCFVVCCLFFFSKLSVLRMG